MNNSAAGRPVLLIGNDNNEVVKNLVDLLNADFVSLPALPQTLPGNFAEDWPWSGQLGQWRETAASGACYQKIVVAVWQNQLQEQVLVETDFSQWVQRCEAPLAWWAAALGCAQQLSADSGAVVALVETASALDSECWVPEVAVAEGVIALVKSLARSEGGRDVRFNAITTATRISADKTVVAPPPPLNSFPGTLEKEVIGAVRLLLQDDACGLTGTVLHADCGRT